MAKRGSQRQHSKVVWPGFSNAPEPRNIKKVGRNEPCPCQSGKKYKDCHEKDGEAYLKKLAMEEDKARLHQLALTLIGEFIQNVADHCLGIDLAQNGGRFSHSHGAAAKGLNAQSQLGKIIGNLQQARTLPIREFNDFGDQQTLGRDAILGHLTFEALINEPFMGCVLIDNHHPVTGLGDDIILMHLPACCAKGLILGGGLRLLNRCLFNQTATVSA